MLVLSRRKNESIRIGDEIQITVLDVRGGQVRIGIEAPREICVLRGELMPPAETQRRPNGTSPAEPNPTLHLRDASVGNDTLRSGNARSSTRSGNRNSMRPR